MRIELEAPGLAAGRVSLVGNPLKFSRSSVAYRRAPPRVGEHDRELDEGWSRPAIESY